jgi:hypothetical protein
MSLLRDLWKAMKFYGVATIGGAVGTFVVVQAWRVIHLGLVEVGRWAYHAETATVGLVVSAGYLAIAAIYLCMPGDASDQRGLKLLATLRFAMALAILAGTGGIYGLFVTMGSLFPSLSRFDVYSATLLTMSVLLLGGMLMRRRTRH